MAEPRIGDRRLSIGRKPRVPQVIRPLSFAALTTGGSLLRDSGLPWGTETIRKKHGKYTPSSPLTDVRGLLSTGLLEGFPVTYKRDEVELNGFVKDLGYQCGCSSCDYTKVIAL
ncbi:hypothetical protein BHM03_00060568 [Ensete ventricosum]|nr:hypothetical protein BHM03_00060568 [Ensete ventricosum]